MKKISLLSFLILLIGTQALSAQAYTAKVAFGQEKLAVRELRRNAITGNIEPGINSKYTHVLKI